ncbi:MAG: formate dehydrogenase subunit delta [Alphaproteobacteria bacterium]|nr:formate dehydrogenase subunit delta [Alphaproteobacteria bacterium]
MTVADIVRMANQISDFFKAYPHDVAVRDTAAHLRNFWDPRMRAQLLEHLDAGGEGLSDIAREAASLLGKEAEPTP